MRRFDAQWDRVTLSDKNAIKGLIKFRHTFDIGFSRRGDIRYKMESGCDMSDMSEDLICIYIDLDNLIERVGFNEYQSEILNMYMEGNNEDDIADSTGITRQAVTRLIDRMCDEICNANKESWKMDYVYWDKVKVSTDYKKCSKCGEFLPITEEYFSPRNDDKSGGFYSYCRKCGIY